MAGRNNDGFDIVSYLMGKQAGGGGGGGDITVESKSINANGTYTAPTGKAYSPVSVDVPNSYAAGDEGKVVSNGALVAQGSDTVTQNGTVDTTLISSLLVNVSGGGGLEYETGTWTPTSDVSTATDNKIMFTNSHLAIPFFVSIEDVTDSLASTDSMLLKTVVNYEALCGGVRTSETASYLARMMYCNKTSSSYTMSGSHYTAHSQIVAVVDEYGFNTKVSSGTFYWRSGRVYKWIAVWAPTA